MYICIYHTLLPSADLTICGGSYCQTGLANLSLCLHYGPYYHSYAFRDVAIIECVMAAVTTRSSYTLISRALLVTAFRGDLHLLHRTFATRASMKEDAAVYEIREDGTER